MGKAALRQVRNVQAGPKGQARFPVNHHTPNRRGRPQPPREYEASGLSAAFEFSDLTALRIEHRAARLARLFCLDPSARDDIRQQLWLRAVQAADRYRPGRNASLDHFVRLHLDYEYRDLRKELTAERAFGRVPATGPCPRWPTTEPDHRPSCDLRLDIEAAEERLPDRLKTVTLRLRHLTPAQIAAELGVHRGTVYRELVLLREVLEDFFAEDGIPRDNPGGDAERSCRGGRATRPVAGGHPVPDPPSQRCRATRSDDRGRP